MTPLPNLFEQDWPEGDYRFFQLGFVVADLLEAAGRWVSVFGVGPFHVLPPRPAACTHRGESGSIEMQVAVAQAGPVQIELVQQLCDSPSIFRDHLDTDGHAALHQLCTITEEFDTKLGAFHALGYEVVTELHAPGQRVAFVDTLDDFGFYTEVVDSTPDFVPNLTRIARTCEEWDGTTDPIRLLTRAGYEVP